ncbi:hypothetical protein BGZ92_011075, partial [Podila epicladia]
DGKWEVIALSEKTFKLRNVESPNIFMYDNPNMASLDTMTMATPMASGLTWIRKNILVAID